VRLALAIGFGELDLGEGMRRKVFGTGARIS
jgi:hypothetical protein